MRQGKGRVILRTLDIADQVPHDPAAKALWHRLLAYALEKPAPPRDRDGIAPNDFLLRYFEKDPLFAATNAIHKHLAEPGQEKLSGLIQSFAALEKRANEEPWLRFARWRYIRVQHQLRANAGETFPADSRVFHPRCDAIDLSGIWEFRPVQHQSAPPGKPLADSGLNAMRKELCLSLEKRELFKTVWLPESLMNDVDADGILRRSIELPAHWKGQTITLDFGSLQSTAMIFLNGQLVSGDSLLPEDQSIRLTVPGGIVQAGKNVLALRLWDSQGPGGFAQPASVTLSLALKNAPPLLPIYSPDYRADFDDGDEPCRFFRW